jgi:hypothetical protein
VEPCSPKTVNVATHKRSSERTYLESFRRQYYEAILPAHAELRAEYESLATRHQAFADLPPVYEVDRFLNWAKLEFTTDETLQSFPLLEQNKRRTHIRDRAQQWFETAIEIDEVRTSRLNRLKEIFRTSQSLDAVEFDDLVDALVGCTAFDEQLRFTKGGQSALLANFKRDNDVRRVKRTFRHLAFGKDEFLRRTYDCIFSRDYKLDHFGQSSVLELFGWTNGDGVPPVNGRTIKALRYFGFSVAI